MGDTAMAARRVTTSGVTCLRADGEGLRRESSRSSGRLLLSSILLSLRFVAARDDGRGYVRGRAGAGHMMEQPPSSCLPKLPEWWQDADTEAADVED